MANLSDVASLAGVSISAVSRVLSGSPSARVSPDTRQRIEQAAQTLDYRPNFAARALKSARTYVVALVVPDLTNAVFTELMRGIEVEAGERGYVVLLARAESLQPGGESLRRLLGEGRVDGLMVQVGDGSAGAELAALIEGTVPAILINSTLSGHVGSVILQDEAGSRVAVDHLVGLGHRAIGLINGSPETATARRRLAGFESAMADAGLDPVAVTSLGYEPEQGRVALRAMMAGPARPTAVVVANVNAALGALLEARTLGIRVPEELSIITIHDAWTAATTWPPLTTVRMPLYELGRLAMTALFENLTDGVVDDRVVSDPAPQLVLRESTASPISS